MEALEFGVRRGLTYPRESMVGVEEQFALILAPEIATEESIFYTLFKY